MGVSVSAITKPRALGKNGWVVYDRNQGFSRAEDQRDGRQMQRHESDINFFAFPPPSPVALEMQNATAPATSRPPSPRLYCPMSPDSKCYKERDVSEFERQTHPTNKRDEVALFRSSQALASDTAAVEKKQMARHSPSFEANGGYYLPYEDDSLASPTPERERSNDAPQSTASAAAAATREGNQVCSPSTSHLNVEHKTVFSLRSREYHPRKRGFLQRNRRGYRKRPKHARRSNARRSTARRSSAQAATKDGDTDAREVPPTKRSAGPGTKFLRDLWKSSPPKNDKTSSKKKSRHHRKADGSATTASSVRRAGRATQKNRRGSPRRESFADYYLTDGDPILPREGSCPAVVLVSQSDFDIARANMTHPTGTITVPAIAITSDGHGSFTVNGNDVNDGACSSHSSNEGENEEVTSLLSLSPHNQTLCDGNEKNRILPNVSSLLELERNTSGLVKPEYFHRASTHC